MLWLGLAGRCAVLPHAPLVPTAEELTPLARVRALLASSTPTNRNPVRIVFYGQSITQGPWWQQVAGELRRLYPHADLRIDNRAISGFQDWALARTVQADLLPLQPDLVIFHAYGTGNGTDDFLRQLRAGTTAEILVQTDHPHEDLAMDEETDPDKLSSTNALAYRNYVGLPGDTRRNGAALARIRDAWKAYCRSNSLRPRSLLVDSIHPNEDGYQLMAEFVLAYLRPDGTPPELDPWNCTRVRSLQLGHPAMWKNRTLECDFTGATITVTLAGQLTGDIEVWIDGQRAANRPELLGFNRVSPTHFSAWPTLTRVGHNQPLQEEEWTFTPHHVASSGLTYGFSVSGSLTGPDGEGTNTLRFVSKSGRVVIEPRDHWIYYSVYFSKGRPLPDGFSARWQVVRHFLDPIPASLSPPTGERRQLQIAQGLSDGPHHLRLVLSAGSPAALAAMQVYSPSGQASIRNPLPTLPYPEGRLQIVELQQHPNLVWTDPTGGWHLESSLSLWPNATWLPVASTWIATQGDSRFVVLTGFPEPTFFRLIPFPEPPSSSIPSLRLP